MEQGMLIRELASIRVREDTVTDWEKERRVPAKRHTETLRGAIPGLAAIAQDSYQRIAGQILGSTPIYAYPYLFGLVRIPD